MTSLPLTILLYQFIAAFGGLALSVVIASFTSTDSLLMYQQGPIDKMLNWKRFKNNRLSKLMVIVISAVSALIFFLPTLFTLAMECMGYKEYYYTNIELHDQEDGASSMIFPTPLREYPPFDDFRRVSWTDRPQEAEYETVTWFSTDAIIKNYLYTHLDLPFDTNPSGTWFGSTKNLSLESPYGYSSDSIYYRYMKYQRLNEAPTPQRVDASTGKYYTHDGTPTYTFGLAGQNSFSLSNCHGHLTSNLPDFEGHKVLAVSNVTAGRFCYPLFDSSLPVTVQLGATTKQSVLDDHDSMFRASRLGKNEQSSSAISISAMNLNDTYLTMAIKKSVHVTYHNEFVQYGDTELLNCSTARLDGISSTNLYEEFGTLKHTKTLCQLKSIALANPGFNMLQAAYRSFETNSSINAVYTYTAPSSENPIGGLAVDLTWFAAYALESPLFQLPEGEHLIAHAVNNEDRGTPSDLEGVLFYADIFKTSDQADPVWPNLVKIQAALKANNTQYFSKTTASVHLAYDLSYSNKWAWMVGVTGSVFFVLAYLATGKNQQNLRAWISACPTVDPLTEVKPSKSPVSSKPTRLAFAENAKKSDIPALTVDGKAILLN